LAIETSAKIPPITPCFPHNPISRGYFKTCFSVILNKVKDLELLGNTRFFAALSMTRP
jgi:hypothetical protein